MEDQSPKTGKFGLNYGLLLGTISIVFAVILFVMEMHYQDDIALRLIGILITTAVIVMGIYNFRKANNGFLSIGQALGIGTITVIVGTILYLIYYFVLINFLDPEFVDNIIRLQREELANNGLGSEQIEQQSEMTRKFFWFSYIFIFVISVLVGFVISLIVGLILKRAKPAY